MELMSKAFVVHNDSGEIVSVGRVPTHVRGRIEVKTDMPGYCVTEVELNADQAAMSLKDLHHHHRIHIASHELVRK